MAIIKYNEKQIQELLSIKYVKNCTSKNVTFTQECKLEALRLEWKLWNRKEVFKQLWFPEYIFNSKIPTKSINRWKSNIRNKWKIEEKRWREIKEKYDISKMTKDEELEFLRKKVAILEDIQELMNGNYP